MKAPAHLEPATARWWRHVVGEFELEQHHVRLLTLAAEAWDRGQQARAALNENGLTYIDRLGNPKPRPEIAVERDSRLHFARLVRELDLDHTTVPESRPPGLLSNRG